MFPDQAPTLRGKRLLLRAISRDDFDDVMDNMQYSEYYQFIPNLPATYTEDDAKEYFDKTFEKISTKKRLEWAIVLDGKMIGSINLHEPKERIECVKIGYLVAKPYWGRGFATEALKLVVDYCFSSLNLHRLQAEVYHPNLASARVLEKLGFRLEGRLRDAARSRGEIYDELIFGLLKTDFESEGR